MPNKELTIRPLEQQDETLLLHWLTNLTLLEFYGGRDLNYTEDKIKQDFFPNDDNEHRFIVKYDNKPIGYVQYYPIDEQTSSEYGYDKNIIYGMDQFIGEPNLWNQGIGTLLVKTVVNHIINTYDVNIIVMDPQVRNTRSIKCYEKCGFKIVKLLPEHEMHEGKLEDCYLMQYRK